MYIYGVCVINTEPYIIYKRTTRARFCLRSTRYKWLKIQYAILTISIRSYPVNCSDIVFVFFLFFPVWIGMSRLKQQQQQQQPQHIKTKRIHEKCEKVRSRPIPIRMCFLYFVCFIESVEFFEKGMWMSRQYIVRSDYFVFLTSLNIYIRAHTYIHTGQVTNISILLTKTHTQPKHT